MKRLASLILTLALILAAGSALGDHAHCAVRGTIQTGDGDIPVELDIYTDDDNILITSSLFPDTGLQISGFRTAESDAALAEVYRVLTDGKTAGIIRDCVREWIAFLQPETGTGVYAGDAFERASSVQHTEFTYGDLMLLARRIRRTLGTQDISNELLGEDLEELLMPEKNIRFDLKVYDNGNYASLGIQKAEDTVMTVSLNMENPDAVTLVAGWGTETKNYYWYVQAEKKGENRITITEKAYADDWKTGFPGLGENDLILTRTTEIERTGEKAESIQLSTRLVPANGITPAVATGILRNTNTGRVFEGSFRFEGYDRLSVTLTADLDREPIGNMPARVIDLLSEDNEKLTLLGTEIGTALVPMILQVMEALPEDCLIPAMKLFY